MNTCFASASSIPLHLIESLAGFYRFVEPVPLILECYEITLHVFHEVLKPCMRRHRQLVNLKTAAVNMKECNDFAVLYESFQAFK